MTGYLEHSREPLRPVVSTADGLEECLDALRAATGPVAFDAERAHGYRYWPKAYLFQIRREGAGTWLIDPLPFEDDGLSRLVEACGDAEWIIHAASQDLPCMRDIDILPSRIFDTELGGRLLGKPGVALGMLLKYELGIKLRKAHSAVNWSQRPLKESWLTYAALDVDYLIELRDTIDEQLTATGRREWAQEEFDWELAHHSVAPPPAPEPWRRLSGITNLRNTRQLAVARELWQERDAIARHRDRPPSHILADLAIVDLAATARSPETMPGADKLASVPGFRTPSARRYRTNWVRALSKAEQLPESSYPARRPKLTGLPHPRSWERNNPEAAARWERVRPRVDGLACELSFMSSMIAPPSVIQRAVYEATAGAPDAARLRELGARSWQAEFLEPLLKEALE
ncbi:HRDC domain-containing protein [Tessaracoccus caeni]|uniref:HRDC domain-containing protein n=1 Tax=Tessaracoccus caeni TaxID=3031239 RepID=UPI0023DB1522|nr:HRDC domain-containing protein [Tessaracoccus caeni]MDF1488518.1 HRDC domain-containing protein [Tessaracoccus caeni]